MATHAETREVGRMLAEQVGALLEVTADAQDEAEEAKKAAKTEIIALRAQVARLEDEKKTLESEKKRKRDEADGNARGIGEKVAGEASSSVTP